MLTMQTFYERLFSAQDSHNPYLSCLFKLTQVNLDAITALKSNLAWSIWDAETD